MWQRPTLRLAAVAGGVMAWAFLSDPYYAVYCLMMLMVMVGHSLATIERRPADVRRVWWRMVLDLLLLSLAGLIAGIAIRGGGRLELFGLRLSMTRLYTPVLLFTLLLALRIVADGQAQVLLARAAANSGISVPRSSAYSRAP